MDWKTTWTGLWFSVSSLEFLVCYSQLITQLELLSLLLGTGTCHTNGPSWKMNAIKTSFFFKPLKLHIPTLKTPH